MLGDCGLRRYRTRMDPRHKTIRRTRRASPPRLACPDRAFSDAKRTPPHPPRAAGFGAFPSYPYCFAPGQPGQPGQTPETMTNRAFKFSILHKSTGTQPGHAGTLRYQGVARQAARAITGRRNMPGLGCRRVRFAPNWRSSQPRPSVPPWSLVGIARQGGEGFAAPQ
jgi:hypothetical protein